MEKAKSFLGKTHMINGSGGKPGNGVRSTTTNKNRPVSMGGMRMSNHHQFTFPRPMRSRMT